MGVLTFDSDRVRMLRRELGELSAELDGCLRRPMPPDTQAALRRAQDAVDLQIHRVDSALLAASSGRLGQTRPCWTIGDLVDRYTRWGGQTRHWWTHATVRESTASDEILSGLECGVDPDRPGALVDSLESLEYLVLGTASLPLLEAVLSRATDPLTTPPVAASRRIRRILEVVFDDRTWEEGPAWAKIDPLERARREAELRRIAARLAAPWQIHFVASARWFSSETEGVERLHQLADLESAAEELARGLPDAVLDSLSDLPSDPTERLGRIDSVAGAIGAAVEVQRLSRIRNSERETGIETLQKVLKTLSIEAPWPFSILVDSGARWISAYFESSDDGIRAATLASLTQREVLASIAVFAVWKSALSREKTESAYPADGRSRKPADIASELRHTYQAVDNAAGRGQALAQITAP